MNKKNFVCLVCTEKLKGSVNFKISRFDKTMMLSWTNSCGFLCRSKLMRIKLTRLSQKERSRIASYRRWLKEID